MDASTPLSKIWALLSGLLDEGGSGARGLSGGGSMSSRKSSGSGSVSPNLPSVCQHRNDKIAKTKAETRVSPEASYDKFYDPAVPVLAEYRTLVQRLHSGYLLHRGRQQVKRIRQPVLF